MPDDRPRGDSSTLGTQPQESLPTLLPLTPEYKEALHGLYLRHLKAALGGPTRSLIHNIALTGSYGIGKSSILGKLATDIGESCIGLSLSTLGDEPESPEKRAASDAAGPAAATPKPMHTSPAPITNRIQKEIVKQLLYREQPWKVRDSRFRRIGRFRFLPQLPVSMLASGLLLPVIYALHGTDRIVRFAGSTVPPFAGTSIAPRTATYAAVFACLVLGISGIRYIAAQSQIQLEKLGAGPATVTLSGRSDSYFDEYLDEIVYFFEMSKCSVVIFEDMDRFDESHIFETLRELNTILNNSNQLKQQVRFVYAIKDSIFERLESSQQPSDEPTPSAPRNEGNPRANRTKFFDLVIPVVPFITHRNARDLMSDIMVGHPKVSKELIDLAAKHITDMRMIKNIRNEFVVFKEKLDVQRAELPGLTDDALFALIVYKNVHLSDFEKIKEGTSDLDELYRASRRIVDSNLRRLRLEALDIKRRQQRNSSIDMRSKHLGDRIEEYVRRILSYFNVTPNVAIQYSHAGSVVSTERLRSVEFWRTFLDPETPPDLIVNSSYVPGSMTLSRAALEIALGEKLSEELWSEVEVEELTQELEANSADQLLLRTADMSQLFQQPKFKLTNDIGSISFRNHTEAVLATPLGVELIAGDYINRNFTLYVSQYYGLHVSLNAMNYLVHHVYANEPDTTFPLTVSDVEALVQEAGTSILNDRSMYNISIVDHLVTQDRLPVQGLINNLVQWGEQEREFVGAYVADGRHVKELYRLLSPSWPHVFSSIIDLRNAIDESTRLTMLDGALQGANRLVKYETNDEIAGLVADHYTKLDAITDPINAAAAATLVRNLGRFGVIFPSLRDLDRRVRQGVIERHMYLLNSENLTSALDGSEDYSLDKILSKNTDIYEYVLDRLQDYIAIIETSPNDQRTVKSESEFIRVLQDVHAQSAAAVGYVARHAAPECRIDTITEAVEDIWPLVVDARRLALNFANVEAYTDTYGIDQHLASALCAAGSIDRGADTEESRCRAWAMAAINANELIPDPAIRVDLVDSLNLADPLDVSEIQPQDGPLYGLLLRNQLLADSAETYAAIAAIGPNARTAFITQSPDFINYVAPELIKPSHVTFLLTSDQISNSVKLKLISFLPEFDPATMSSQQARVIAEWALQHNVDIPWNSLQILAECGAEAAIVVRLLGPNLPTITVDQLVAILRALGQPYSDVAEQNGGRTRIPTSDDNKALLRKLRSLRMVTHYKTRRGLTEIDIAPPAGNQ